MTGFPVAGYPFNDWRYSRGRIPTIRSNIA
jgi:hypothetical protein